MTGRYLGQIFALLVMLGVGVSLGMQVVEENMQLADGLAGPVQEAMSVPALEPTGQVTPEPLAPATSASPFLTPQAEPSPSWWGNRIRILLQDTVRFSLSRLTEGVQALIRFLSFA